MKIDEKGRVEVTVAAVVLGLMLVFGVFFALGWALSQPSRTRYSMDKDVHIICSVDGAAYMAAAPDGVSDTKDVIRIRDGDKLCPRN